MLDTFEILTTSGVVLWSRSYTSISASIINSFIASVFIEEKVLQSGRFVDDASAAENPPYRHEQHTVKWTMVKELNVIFVAVYRSLLHLSWVDRLVHHIKILFVDLYGDQLKRPHTTVVECDFDDYFDQQLGKLEKIPINEGIQVADNSAFLEEAPASITANLQAKPPPLPEYLRSRAPSGNPKHEIVPVVSNLSTAPDSSRLSIPAGHLLVAKGGPGGKTSRRARKAAHLPSAHASSGEESQSRKGESGKAAPKKGRRWDADGLASDDNDDVPLDYSTPIGAELTTYGDSTTELRNVDQTLWGVKTRKGEFVLKDLDDHVNSILLAADAKKTDTATSSTGLVGSSLNAIGSLLRNVVGGKILTKEDLNKAMKGMEEHLLKKNVAREAAVRLCEGVERELLGLKIGTFENVQARTHTAMESSLRKILTPTSSLDLLREIDSVVTPSALSLQERRPYVISIVGVNGVGKSTNLSKICYFLLQNKYKVLIVACDTFRSGAVEQLAVHVRNLKELTAREGGEVELYQKGYGKDAANVAKDAVSFAAHDGFDVVLIDTAGRRHNDQRLMSSLEKFAKSANPDKILMVGEALVGTDSVAQARNFNMAFGSSRSLDGFIISKCDTVGDMVGTLVSMVHATAVPVLFVGVGQHYSDLRNLSVKWAVDRLLSAV